MNRREFLAISGVGAVTATTGCLGYTIQSTDEIDRRQARIDELENRIDGIESELNSTQTENAELEDEVTELENDLTDAQSEQILWLYSSGINHYNNGIDKYRSGFDYFSEENYTATRAEMNVAVGYFDAATDNFDVASNRASDDEEISVESYCSDASSKSNQLALACSDYQTGAYYYTQNENTTAENYIDDGDRHYSNMESYELRDLSTLEDELGITIDV